MNTKLIERYTERFFSGLGFESITQARQFACSITGEKVIPGTPAAKELDETIERSLVLVGREIVRSTEPGEATYKKLVDLYELQPRLAVKSSSSIELQAYSTPLPLAYFIAYTLDIRANETVYEPTAGNGALLITCDPKQVHANELDPSRARWLTEGLKVNRGTARDATIYEPMHQYDVVLGNPPFATSQFNRRVFRHPLGGCTKNLDHIIVWNALDSLKEGGRAAFIIRGHLGGDAARRRAYSSLSQRRFYKSLFDNYRVTQHFTVSGDLYQRQGAGYPVDVLFIANDGSTTDRELPGCEVPLMVGNFEELWHGRKTNSLFSQECR
jgi:hypothetical protein